MSAETYRNNIEKPSDRVIVALDNMDWDQATVLVDQISPSIGMAKANSLAQNRGWQHAVTTLGNLGVRTMADAKYHDIPETVRLHVREATRCGPKLITVHASSKKEMLEAAVKGRDQAREEYQEHLFAEKYVELTGGILGVTVLTSLDKDECISIYGDTPEKKVMQFARTALDAGVDGIVCSGKELKAIRADSSLDDLLAVVPGITPEWAAKAGDQKRVVTPAEALQEGADFIVVGRAITKPPEGISSFEASLRIAEELEEVA